MLEIIKKGGWSSEHKSKSDGCYCFMLYNRYRPVHEEHGGTFQCSDKTPTSKRRTSQCLAPVSGIHQGKDGFLRFGSWTAMFQHLSDTWYRWYGRGDKLICDTLI